MDDVIARARAKWRQESLGALRSSPLGGIGQWLATGNPPVSEALRSAGFTSGGGPDARYVRKGFVHTWGCSIPCREAVDALSGLGPLVELAAGTGYWSRLLSAAGVDVVATDNKVAHVHDFSGEWGRHFPVETLAARSAVLAYPARSAFCSWPSKDSAWLVDALALMRPGQSFAMISETAGGLGPAAEVFACLADAFDEVETVTIPQFPPHSDALRIWRRREC
jgi:hypothetical protein